MKREKFSGWYLGSIVKSTGGGLYKANIIHDGKIIARIFDESRAVVKERGELIAAALELLEALEFVSKNVKSDTAEMWGMVEAAIAKAKGE